MSNEKTIAKAIAEIEKNKPKYELLHDKFISIVNRDPNLKKLVHSHKSRFKDIESLKEKIIRKNKEDLKRPKTERLGKITKDNILDRITDFCGIRVIHLHLGQFSEIHNSIMNYVNSQELALYEKPKAYTWDPEYSEQFNSLGLESQWKESFYTSIHYVIKPRPDSPITCEIQVRTLFEEVWGELNHKLNYPVPSNNIAIQEQLKVLARLVGAGTRLTDSIINTNNAQNGST